MIDNVGQEYAPASLYFVKNSVLHKHKNPIYCVSKIGAKIFKKI